MADGDEYGAEEAEEEEEELAEAEGSGVVDPDAMVEDSEMAGADVDPAAEESDDGSEDLEAESSGSEDEELEEEAAEGDVDMEIDGGEKPVVPGVEHQHMDAVMAH